jgi:hypothetical protein
MRHYATYSLILIIVATLMYGQVQAENADGLMAAFEQIRDSRLDPATTGIITNFTLEHRDMRLIIDSGRIAFLEPVIIDSKPHVYGAYFEGYGRFFYEPSEDDAMARIEFYRDENSITVEFTKVMLAFSSDTYEMLKSQIQPAANKFEKKQKKRLQKSWERLTKYENHYHAFQILRNLVEPPAEPYLLVNPQDNGWGHSYYYVYDPVVSDEVRLMQSVVRGPNFAQYLKTLCSYTCTVRETQDQCGELTEPQVRAGHYTIELSMNEYGDCVCKVGMEFEVLKEPAQLLWMFLHEEADISSISSPEHSHVYSLRHKKDKNQCETLYLLLDNPMEVGDRFTLYFNYDAPLFSRSGRDFKGNLGSAWYPTYVDPGKATYEMTYRVPYYDDLKFVSSGTLIDLEKDGHWAMQRWEVAEPDYQVTFGFEEVEN